MPEQGDVLLIPIPFTDLSSRKRRPVIVISNDAYNRRTADIVVVAMTSNPAPADYSIQVDDAVPEGAPLAQRGDDQRRQQGAYGSHCAGRFGQGDALVAQSALDCGIENHGGVEKWPQVRDLATLARLNRFERQVDDSPLARRTAHQLVAQMGLAAFKDQQGQVGLEIGQ